MRGVVGSLDRCIHTRTRVVCERNTYGVLGATIFPIENPLILQINLGAHIHVINIKKSLRGDGL